MLNNDNNYVKEIITDLDALSQRSEEVNVLKDNTEVRETIVELKNTLREYKTGVGLAAPQIGKYTRIFVINFNGDLRTFINPIITNSENITLNREGCLSLPGKEYILPRFGNISVMYQDPQGKTQTVKLMGMAAFVFQHELDHLDGVLISDIGLEIDKDFDNATQEERDEIIKMYLESLDIKTKASAKEVEEDPELKKMNDSIKFMEKVQKGEIQVEQREFTEKEKEQLEKKLNENKDE